MNDLTTEILIGITIAIFLIFIYTLFFFNWLKDIKFWPKKKHIVAILTKYANKRKAKNILNQLYNEMKAIYSKNNEDNLKLHRALEKYQNSKLDKKPKNLLNELLKKIVAENKYMFVSKNFQILFTKIETQLKQDTIDKKKLQEDITLIYNKIGEVEMGSISSKKAYWVGVIGIIISVLIYLLPKIFNF